MKIHIFNTKNAFIDMRDEEGEPLNHEYGLWYEEKDGQYIFTPQLEPPCLGFAPFTLEVEKDVRLVAESDNYLKRVNFEKAYQFIEEMESFLWSTRIINSQLEILSEKTF